MIDLKNKGTRLTVIAVSIVIGVIVIYFSAVDPSFKFRPFNEAAWKNGDARTRGEMVNDLLNSPILVNKSMEDIKTLLGAGEVRDRVLYYSIELGVKVGYEPSVFELAIIFDRNNQAIDYEIVEQGKAPNKLGKTKESKSK